MRFVAIVLMLAAGIAFVRGSTLVAGWTLIAAALWGFSAGAYVGRGILPWPRERIKPRVRVLAKRRGP